MGLHILAKKVEANTYYTVVNAGLKKELSMRLSEIKCGNTISSSYYTLANRQ